MKRDLLKALLDDDDDEEVRPLTKKEKAALDEGVKAFTTRHVFKVGDKVQTKECIRAAKHPQKGKYGVISEILDNPRPYIGDGHNHHADMEDVVVVILDDRDNTVARFLFDSIYLEPYVE